MAAAVLRSRAETELPRPSRPGAPEAKAPPTSELVSAGIRPSAQPHPVVAYETDADEALGVVSASRRARGPGASWSSLAVLARTNAQLVLFERELQAANVPFRSGGGRAFLARPTVRRALDRLTGPADPPAFHAWLDDLTAWLAGPTAAIAECEPDPFATADPAAEPSRLSEADEDLAELANLALEYLGWDLRPSGEAFVSWLEASLRSDPPRQAGDAVDVMTFHRAKGLEWRVVFVTGLEDGLVPIAHARDLEALAEERRLLYVACTRAMDDLRCSWACGAHLRRPPYGPQALSVSLRDRVHPPRPRPARGRHTGELAGLSAGGAGSPRRPRALPPGALRRGSGAATAGARRRPDRVVPMVRPPE